MTSACSLCSSGDASVASPGKPRQSVGLATASFHRATTARARLRGPRAAQSKPDAGRAADKGNRLVPDQAGAATAATRARPCHLKGRVVASSHRHRRYLVRPTRVRSPRCTRAARGAMPPDFPRVVPLLDSSATDCSRVSAVLHE
eukprot:scaffold503_cov365-Prasinococcus_capsulatus_cf.AAC.6